MIVCDEILRSCRCPNTYLGSSELIPYFALLVHAIFVAILIHRFSCLYPSDSLPYPVQIYFYTEWE